MTTQTRRGYSVEQVRAAEAPHLAAGESLMQRAATALAAEIRLLLSLGGGSGVTDDADAGGLRRARVLLLVGSGDNGGDTLFAGAQLASTGVAVSIVSAGSRMHEAGLTAAITAGAVVEDSSRVGQLAASAEVIVDGILGIGVSGSPALRGQAREVVLAVLRARERDDSARVVAVDLPSGVGPDDGAVPDAAILRADLTVTFGAIKAGLLLEPGASFAGEVRVIDLGLGEDYAVMTAVVEVAGATPTVRSSEPAPRTRAGRVSTLVANIVSAVALTVLVGAIVFLAANVLSAEQNGPIVDEMFRQIGPGFSEASVDLAWWVFGGAAAVLAVSGLAGVFLRRQHSATATVFILLTGGVVTAVAVFGAGLLALLGVVEVLLPVPIAALGIAFVWATTLSELVAASPVERDSREREATERRLQRRIDVALGVGSLVVFVGPMLYFLVGIALAGG